MKTYQVIFQQNILINVFNCKLIFLINVFLYHTKYLYGIYTLNQAPIVLSVENSFSTNFSRFFII